MKRAQFKSPAGLIVIVLLIIGFFIGSVVGAKMIAYTHTVEMVETKTKSLTMYSTISETRVITTTSTTTTTAELISTTTITMFDTTTLSTTINYTRTLNHTITVANTTTTITIEPTVTKTVTNTTTTTTTMRQLELVCFSRYEYCIAEITSRIKKASKYIYVLAYLLTSDDIADALIDAHNKNVNVKIIVERSMVNVTGSDYWRLKQAGIDTRVENTTYLLHHKIIIIDGKIVITGSYNFSRAAEDENYENLIIINDPEIVHAYEEEFSRVIQNSVIL